MSIKKYETLLRTVDLGSLTRASEELGYTQSAISQIISGLEEEMGLKLLIRDRSGVRLTEVGARILPAIRAVCEANEEVLRRVAELHKMEFEHLRIGTQSGAPSHLLASLLKRFQLQCPHVHLELMQGDPSEMERMVMLGNLDCAILYAKQSESLESICIADEPLVAVFPTSRTEEPPVYSLECLSDEVLILNRNDVPEMLRPLLKKARADERIYSSGQDDSAVLAMVAAGLGMSILPEKQVLHNRGAVITRSCNPPISRRINLVVPKRKNSSSVARQFIQLAKEGLDFYQDIE